MANQFDNVARVRQEVLDMQAAAAVCRALLGGTEGMREAGKTYLPQWPLEEDDGWTARRDCSVLFPAFEDSIDAMIGKPLGEPIVTEGVPASVEGLLEDIDRTGRDLDTFARDWMKDGLCDGITWAVVDYPQVPAGSTLAQERALGARPYVIQVPLQNVVGWKLGSHGKVAEFRYMEFVEVPDPSDPWGTMMEERVRVLRPGEVEVYRLTTQDEKPVWSLAPELSGPVSLKSEVPVACFNPGRKGHFIARPVLSNLAWLNVQHWQSASDQRNILHVARVPLLFAPGFNETDSLVAGAQSAIKGPQNSDLKYVEHTGAAISAGRDDLLDLQEQMRLVAGKVLTRQAGGDKSATEAGLEARDGGSKLRAWCWTFQDALENILRLMALWMGESQGGSVVLNMDWEDIEDPAMFQTLLQARQSGNLSRESWVYNLSRMGYLQPGRTIQEEIDALSVEGPTPIPRTTPMPGTSAGVKA